MKGRVKLVVVVAGLHAAAVLATLVLGIGGASAHAGADEAGSARVGWLRASQVLAFPGGQLQAFINGLLPSGERLSSPGEWLIFTGNSLLWGFVLVFAIRRLVGRPGTRRRSSPIATRTVDGGLDPPRPRTTPGGPRMRVLLLAPLLVCVATRAAWATGQVPERIVVNGQVHDLYSTPLAPLLEQREDLEGKLPSWSSGCWRGYVGSWQVVGDRLELVAMTHGDDPPWPGFRSDDSSDVTGPGHDALPLLFGDRKPPFVATWYTGELRVPITARRSYVHMGFATTWERELVLDVVRGRIQGRRVLDRRELMKGRSKEDQVWVGLAATANAAARGAAPLDDRGPWLDARMLDTGGFDHRIPAGEMFVTRGILLREEPDKEPFLWIPETDVSREVRLPLHAKALPGGTRTWPHVELEATWKTESGRSVLEVSWMRLLVPGETIHRTDLDWRALPPKGPDVDEYRSRSPYTRDETPVASRKDVESLHVALPWAYLHGTLEGPRASSVHGVEVAPSPALAGETVVVEGHLQTWVITERLLRLELPEMEPFRARGPGTYYRLVDEYTGALATPRTVGKPR